MKILENILLAPYTTFKIGGPARYFCEATDQFDALAAFEFAKEKKVPVFVLGGGSNLLVSDKGYEGLVVRIVNKGIEFITLSPKLLALSPNRVFLKVAAGENWDGVVDFAVKNGWWGMENLSHIPGSAGAIAVQNVGAYGQEAKNIVKSVTVFNTQTHQISEILNKDCGFEYRKSIFNTSQKGKYIIFYITFSLSVLPKPVLDYRDLKNNPELIEIKNKKILLKKIREAVTKIRDKKYPFPTQAKFGNAGSFFKNAQLTESEYGNFLKNFGLKFGQAKADDLESKIFREERIVKIPSAYLIEICGLKNLKSGGAKINSNQPLVIINSTGQASSSDVLNLAKLVIESVFNQTGIKLQIEPEFLGIDKTKL